MSGRGSLTPEIVAKAVEVLGVEITMRELRLMPYISSVMMDSQVIDPRRINEEERGILRTWKDRGWIEGGASGLAVSKTFWSAIHEILWLGYVAYNPEAVVAKPEQKYEHVSL